MEALFTIPKEQIDQINSRLQKIEQLLSQSQKPVLEWVSAKDAQTLLGVGQTTLWQYRNDGKIKASKINKKLYFRKADILALLENGVE